MALPRMRGIKEAVQEIRSADPQTAITEHFLRGLIKTKTIPCVLAGTKQLVNMDILESYLQNPVPVKKDLPSGIRRIAE